MTVIKRLLNNISTLLCKKSWNDTKYIFHDRKIKQIKHMAERRFIVLRGVNGTPHFWHNHLLILFNNILCYCKALNNDGKKWLLLDVNPKTRFLDLQKIQKASKIQKYLNNNGPKEIHSYKKQSKTVLKKGKQQSKMVNTVKTIKIGQKRSTMVKNGQYCEKWPKTVKIKLVKNGEKKMVNNGQKRLTTVNNCQYGQNWLIKKNKK